MKLNYQFPKNSNIYTNRMIKMEMLDSKCEICKMQLMALESVPFRFFNTEFAQILALAGIGAAFGYCIYKARNYKSPSSDAKHVPLLDDGPPPLSRRSLLVRHSKTARSPTNKIMPIKAKNSTQNISNSSNSSSNGSNTKPVIRSAGLLVYRRRQNLNLYLLLQASYEPFHWTPPKGHVNPGEDEWAVALRETREETGISADQLEIDKNFQHVMRYSAKENPKTVTYWLARPKNDVDIQISHKHQKYQWVNLNEAVELTKFPKMEVLLKEAEKYINKNST